MQHLTPTLIVYRYIWNICDNMELRTPPPLSFFTSCQNVAFSTQFQTQHGPSIVPTKIIRTALTPLWALLCKPPVSSTLRVFIYGMAPCVSTEPPIWNLCWQELKVIFCILQEQIYNTYLDYICHFLAIFIFTLENGFWKSKHCLQK